MKVIRRIAILVVLAVAFVIMPVLVGDADMLSSEINTVVSASVGGMNDDGVVLLEEQETAEDIVIPEDPEVTSI